MTNKTKAKKNCTDFHISYLMSVQEKKIVERAFVCIWFTKVITNVGKAIKTQSSETSSTASVAVTLALAYIK